MPETVRCNLCGGSDAVPQPQKARFLAIPAELGIVKCSSCGLIFMSPRPSQDDYVEYYNTDPVYSVSAYNQSEEKRMAFYRRRAYEIERFIGKKGKMLEVGCGTGVFLKLAQDLGWEVCGTELSRQFQQHATEKHHLNVHCAASLGSCGFPHESFDIVCSAHVLEHILDPLGTLREMRRFLRRSGFLLIEVPYQFASLRDRLRYVLMKISGPSGEGKFYSTLFSSVHHVYFFTPKTLRRMVEEAGFSVLKVTTYVNHHVQVIGDDPLGGYWFAEITHRVGRSFGVGPIILLWAKNN